MVRVRAKLCLEMYMLLPEGERQRVEQRTRWLHTIVPITEVESLTRSNTDMYYGIPKLHKDLQAMNEHMDEHMESLDQRMQQRVQQAENNLDGKMDALNDTWDGKMGAL